MDELIEKEADYIVVCLQSFIDKHNLIVDEKRRDYITFINDDFGLRFCYENRYSSYPMMFTDILIILPRSQGDEKYGGKYYFNTRNVINFMKEESGLPTINTYKEISGIRGYLPYLESDVESFLSWPEGQEKLRTS